MSGSQDIQSGSSLCVDQSATTPNHSEEIGQLKQTTQPQLVSTAADSCSTIDPMPENSMDNATTNKESLERVETAKDSSTQGDVEKDQESSVTASGVNTVAIEVAGLEQAESMTSLDGDVPVGKKTESCIEPALLQKPPREKKYVSLSTDVDFSKCAHLDERVEAILRRVMPRSQSNKLRSETFQFFKELIKKRLPDAEVFTFGSCPLRSYLPDGDIDVEIFISSVPGDGWVDILRRTLEEEEKNVVTKESDYPIANILVIPAEFKIIKCTLGNITLDISANKIGGLRTLSFMEYVDTCVTKETGIHHIFKRSILLIKTWCYYESRILGSHHGLISTYALSTMVLYLFNTRCTQFKTPFQVLTEFLLVFSQFNWDEYCLSIYGPIPIKSFIDHPVRDMEIRMKSIQGDYLLSYAETVLFGSKPVSPQEDLFGPNLEAKFLLKSLNIIDPLKPENNIGRSISKASYFRICSAFRRGYEKIVAISKMPVEEGIAAMDDFYRQVFLRHNKGDMHRPDVAGAGKGMHVFQIADGTPERPIHSEAGSKPKPSIEEKRVYDKNHITIESVIHAPSTLAPDNITQSSIELISQSCKSESIPKPSCDETNLLTTHENINDTSISIIDSTVTGNISELRPLTTVQAALEETGDAIADCLDANALFLDTQVKQAYEILSSNPQLLKTFTHNRSTGNSPTYESGRHTYSHHDKSKSSRPFSRQDHQDSSNHGYARNHGYDSRQHSQHHQSARGGYPSQRNSNYQGRSFDDQKGSGTGDTNRSGYNRSMSTNSSMGKSSAQSQFISHSGGSGNMKGGNQSAGGGVYYPNSRGNANRGSASDRKPVFAQPQATQNVAAPGVNQQQYTTAFVLTYHNSQSTPSSPKTSQYSVGEKTYSDNVSDSGSQGSRSSQRSGRGNYGYSSNGAQRQRSTGGQGYEGHNRIGRSQSPTRVTPGTNGDPFPPLSNTLRYVPKDANRQPQD